MRVTGKVSHWQDVMESIGLHYLFAHTPSRSAPHILAKMLCSQYFAMEVAGVDQEAETSSKSAEQEPIRSSWRHTQESPESPTEGNVKQQALPFTETDVHEDNQCSYASDGDEKGAYSPFH